MGNLPVLKPREVAALLEGLGFAERTSEARASSTDLQTAEEPLSRFTLGRTSRPRSYGRSRRTSASRLSSCWAVRRGLANKELELASHGMR